MTADLTNPIFTDEATARAHLEAIRWPTGAYCPHCGECENVHRMEGESHAPGLHYCRSCRKKFSVTVGTLYERSHIPLHKWLLATHLLAASKKGVSAHQLHRMLGITYKSAWFMAHRIREALTGDTSEPMGGAGKIVEADETFIGRKDHTTKSRGYQHKRAVVALVERGGKARTFHVDRVNAKSIAPILAEHVDPASRLMTDEASYYTAAGKAFAGHEVVNHSAKEYVRGEAHTNTLEGYFSVFKRGMKGIYQHCGEQHLHRYLTEFEFRYNNRSRTGVEDAERATKAVRGITGKRLTYRRINEAYDA